MLSGVYPFEDIVESPENSNKNAKSYNEFKSQNLFHHG